MNILYSFIQYAVIAVVLAGVAVSGIFIGKSLRKKKDLKKQQEAE